MDMTVHTDSTMADQKIRILLPMNLSTKHSSETDNKATSMKKYKTDAMRELDTYL